MADAAASFVRALKSAPTKPGVLAAIALNWTAPANRSFLHSTCIIKPAEVNRRIPPHFLHREGRPVPFSQMSSQKHCSGQRRAFSEVLANDVNVQSGSAADIAGHEVVCTVDESCQAPGKVHLPAIVTAIVRVDASCINLAWQTPQPSRRSDQL